jgi:hypothetical protein
VSPRALFVVLACLFAGALAALPQPAAAATLLADDFGPKPLAAWQPSPLGLAGNWDASAGTASYNGGGHTQLWTGDGAWTDYRFEVKVRLATGQNYPGGIRGRIDPATGAGYAAWLYPGDGVIKLFRAAAWNIDTAGLTLLAQTPVATALTRNGSAVTFTTETIKGLTYAAFPATSGTYAATYTP